MKKMLMFTAVAVLAVLPVIAQEQDLEGCKDSTVLSRMKGCAIEGCDKKDFDRAQIRKSASDEDMQASKGRSRSSRTAALTTFRSSASFGTPRTL
ncbi:MAG TPA: hypothetical protein VGK04_10440 [Thermoanaerobaculia bacterium]|jgi:hypothetical protein